MYVLMNKQGQYWDGLGWDSDIGEAERYPTEEDSDREAFVILEEWGEAAAAVELDEYDEDDDEK